jgi:hypothetical protein
MQLKIIIILLIAVTYSTNDSYGQIQNPVKWSYGSKRISETTVMVLIKATIEKGWHIYSTHQLDGGPVKTSFIFLDNQSYKTIGGIEEPKPNNEFDKTFNLQVLYFTNKAVFRQIIKLATKTADIRGVLSYMVCNDHQCLPPSDISFDVKIE